MFAGGTRIQRAAVAFLPLWLCAIASSVAAQGTTDDKGSPPVDVVNELFRSGTYAGSRDRVLDWLQRVLTAFWKRGILAVDRGLILS